MTLNREQVLKKLSNKRNYFKEKYGFNEIMLFGSFASDQASFESDVDIAVKVPGELKTLSNYLGAKKDFSELFEDREIDLVYYNAEFLNPIIKQGIDKEKIIIE